MDFIITPRDETTAVVKLSGQFTFSDTPTFKAMIAQLLNKNTHAICLDFNEVTFIDSAGMGMLLLLRSECSTRQIEISIHSAHGQVEKLFMISKFDQLFSLRTGNA